MILLIVLDLAFHCIILGTFGEDSLQAASMLRVLPSPVSERILGALTREIETVFNLVIQSHIKNGKQSTSCSCVFLRVLQEEIWSFGRVGSRVYIVSGMKYP